MSFEKSCSVTNVGLGLPANRGITNIEYSRKKQKQHRNNLRLREQVLFQFLIISLGPCTGVVWEGGYNINVSCSTTTYVNRDDLNGCSSMTIEMRGEL